jgi:hypothetical protein
MCKHAVYFSDCAGLGIEMVEALGLEHAQDIARAQHPTGRPSVVPGRANQRPGPPQASKSVDQRGGGKGCMAPPRQDSVELIRFPCAFSQQLRGTSSRSGIRVGKWQRSRAHVLTIPGTSPGRAISGEPVSRACRAGRLPGPLQDYAGGDGTALTGVHWPISVVASVVVFGSAITKKTIYPSYCRLLVRLFN